MIHSFDIFDTLLMRDVMPPQALFLRTGEAIARRSGGLPEPRAFLRMRREAEERARKARADGEPTLDEIYSQLAFLANRFFSHPEVESWRHVELECEDASLRPVPGAAARVAAAAASGARVVYLSDTYFPPAFLRRQLEKHGLWAPGAALYASCHERVNKESGGLFDLLLEREGVACHDVTHCGNDAVADCRSARDAGCRAAPETGANATRYEQILADAWEATDGVAAVLAASSRATRLSSEGIDPAVVRVAAGVLSPLLACYLTWVFQRAIAKGIRTLYFVSRDGQLMYEAAQVLAPAVAPQLEIRYLHGSRQAWFIAALTAVDEGSLDWILAADDPTSVRTVLDRVNVDPAAVADGLREYGFAEGDWDRWLDRDELARMRDVMRSPAVSAAVLAAAREAREKTVDYFRQEGLVSADRAGLVDVGWTARTHDCACGLIEEAGGVPPVGFFIGMKKGRRPEGKYDHEGYLFDEYHSLGYLELTYCPIAMETFFTADHGPVRGYARRGGRVEPVLGSPTNESAMGWGYGNVKKVALAYMRDLQASSATLSRPGINMRFACAKLLNAFWLTPVADEARAWGAFPFETDQTCVHSLPLATGFTPADVARVAASGRYQTHAATWMDGSLVLTPAWLRVLLLVTWCARRECLDVLKLLRGRVSVGEFVRRGGRLVRGFARSRRRLWHPPSVEAAG